MWHTNAKYYFYSHAEWTKMPLVSWVLSSECSFQLFVLNQRMPSSFFMQHYLYTTTSSANAPTYTILLLLWTHKMVMVTSLMETGRILLSHLLFTRLTFLAATAPEMQHLSEIVFVNMSMDQVRCHGNGKSYIASLGNQSLAWTWRATLWRCHSYIRFIYFLSIHIHVF